MFHGEVNGFAERTAEIDFVLTPNSPSRAISIFILAVTVTDP
jgi:hypothetical protein